MIPHLPGRTPRPEAAIAPGLEEGLALYRSGFFWEAHEAWEPLWLAAAPNSRERALLQGLIQLANGWLKIRMGRPAAAARIAGLAAEHIARAGTAPCLSIAPDWTAGELDRLHEAIPAPAPNDAISCTAPRAAIPRKPGSL